MSWLKKLGITEEDAKPVEAPAQQTPATNAIGIPSAPSGFPPINGALGTTFTALPQANEQIFNHIWGVLIDPSATHPFAKFQHELGKMRQVIPDEGTQYKAASAAATQSAASITESIGNMKAIVESEKLKFEQTDLAAMNASIADIITEINVRVKRIEDIQNELAALMVERTQLEGAAAQAKQEADVTAAIFNATVAKLHQVLDAENQKINIYLPKEGI